MGGIFYPQRASRGSYGTETPVIATSQALSYLNELVSFFDALPASDLEPFHHSFQRGVTAPDLPLWSKPIPRIRKATGSSK